jgi:hypothetical protein
MILLPLLGLVVGFLIGDRRAFIATAAAAVLGFMLVAIFTDEIESWGDLFVWADTIVALIATMLGIVTRRWWRLRRATRERPA